jgi:hypothetical protein
MMWTTLDAQLLLVAFERLHRHDEKTARQVFDIVTDLSAMAEYIALHLDNDLHFRYSRAQGMVDALVEVVS